MTLSDLGCLIVILFFVFILIMQMKELSLRNKNRRNGKWDDYIN